MSRGASPADLGKPSCSTYVAERLDGFGGEFDVMVITDLADHPETAEVLLADPGFSHMVRPACTGPLAAKDPGAVHRDIELLRDVDPRDFAGTILNLNVSGCLVEGANPRHERDWQVWEDVELPEDKVLIPGVVGTTNNCIEHPELVAQRLERYAKAVGRGRVLAGSDCGFGALAGMRATVPSIAWAKLETRAEGARLASVRLWLPLGVIPPDPAP